MSSETYANSSSEVRVNFRFKDSLDSSLINSQFAYIFKSGLYRKDSPLLEIVSDTSVTVNTYSALVLNPDVTVVDSVTQLPVQRDILSKCDIKTSKTLTGVDYTTPYVVMEFLYSQSETITPTVKNIAYADIDLDKQVVLGKCLYRDNLGTMDELYGFDEERAVTKSTIYEVEKWFTDFMGTPTGDKQITFAGGLLEGVTVSGEVYDYGAGVGEIALPTAGYHRYDFFYVDESDTYQYVIGEEESDPTGDEYPKPQKPSVGLYSFPVAYVYVTSNLSGTRVFQQTDVENIIPRFTRKTQVLSGSLSDVIIASQDDCDAYFGNNDLDDEGGVTPGLYDDGWVCEYNSSVKTVYVPGKRVVFKNYLNTITGLPIPYLIRNRIVLENGAEVYTAKNVILQFSRAFARFETLNQTNMPVFQYSNKTFKVLSEDTQNSDQYADNYGDQLVPVNADNLASFSETPLGNKEYTVDSVIKGIKSELSDTATPGSTWTENNIEILNGSTANVATSIFSVTEFTNGGYNYVVVAYEVNGTPDQIGYAVYRYNTSTKVYDKLGNKDDALSTTYSTITDVVIKNDGTNVHIIFSATGPNSVYHTYTSIANILSYSAFPVVTQVQASTLTLSDFIIDSTNIWYAGKDGSDDLIVVKGVLSGTYGWTTQSVGTSMDLSGTSNLSVIKSSTYVLVTYNDGTDLACTYSANSGSSWADITLQTSYTTAGVFSKMILSGQSNPIYISYSSNTGTAVRFAEIDISGVPVLSSDEQINEGTISGLDLKLNTDNKYPTSENRINVLQTNSSFFSSKVIDNSGDDGAYSSIAIDSDGYIHISYLESSSNYLKYATNKTGSWVIETLEDSDAVSSYTSIAIDSNNYVHISYYDDLNDDLKYITNASGSWVKSTVDSTGNVGTYSSIAIDSDDYIHISYRDETNTSLKYATNTTGSWVASTIDSSADVGTYSSIAIDSDDYIHISYHDSSTGNGILKYTTNKTGSWVSETVDSDGSLLVGSTTSIALDSDKYPSIAYKYDDGGGNYELYYAKWNGTSWDIESVGLYGTDPSLVIDLNDYAHISYHDATNTNLKYATNISGSWVITTIDSVGDVGDFTSMRQAINGLLYISYYDTTNTQLKLALLQGNFAIVHRSLSDTLWGVSPLVSLSGEYDFLGYIASCFNNYLFLALYNGTGDSGTFDDLNYLYKLYYALDISVNEVISLRGLTDVRLSTDFVSKNFLEMTLDSNSQAGDYNFSFANSYNMNAILEVDNSVKTAIVSAIDSESLSKNYNSRLTVVINETNSATNNLSKLNHSTILNSDMIKPSGSKNFNDCKNVSYIGLLDKVTTIENGDIDE